MRCLGNLVGLWRCDKGRRYLSAPVSVAGCQAGGLIRFIDSSKITDFPCLSCSQTSHAGVAGLHELYTRADFKFFSCNVFASNNDYLDSGWRTFGVFFSLRNPALLLMEHFHVTSLPPCCRANNTFFLDLFSCNFSLQHGRRENLLFGCLVSRNLAPRAGRESWTLKLADASSNPFWLNQENF